MRKSRGGQLRMDMLNLEPGQKMFIETEPNTRHKSGRTYLGLLVKETESFIRILIYDEKKQNYYGYVIAKKTIIGWKLYSDIIDISEIVDSSLEQVSSSQ